ncbi:MAG: HAD-IA family hydrolase [Pseudomonadota bacterium]|uniref:phosphoglycolate phosphatase n=1 Tax=Candidatus Desulfatibia profunda TaxID=2841695 RepID=A0A8J6NJG8_9BACT|nr:HAD-IA family hydrolase [Candidatus Desulfatibia profunda]MBL7180657.1 HAD-IA family hydrolase [Desulfobacterales bacterium]
MTYEAVLFDLDGTLLDTLDDIGNCANRVLASRGFPTYTIFSYREFVGEGARALITRALPAGHRNEKLINACLKEFVEDYSVNCIVKSKPYDGIPQMLDALKARGLKLAVLSNKPDSITKACVAALLSKWDFDVVIGQRDSVPRKPDPQGALEVAEKLAIPPSRFLFIGDTAIDMKTAVAAGMFPVGVLWGFRPIEELKGNGARAIIDEPLKLLDLLRDGE